MDINEALIAKYNVPVPRYTSYPTVPYWSEDTMNENQWLQVVKRTFDETNEDSGISLYLHLPYCESLCTYCACNTRITKNHKVESSYIDAILAEWQIYLSVFSQKPKIREMHLGGGTPTFFSPENLDKLISGILRDADVFEQSAFSFEGHPNNTTYEHLSTLYSLGFKRVSYGVQDLDIKVQQTINRVQPFENVKRATVDARNIGYESVNFDLVYGLPFQTHEGIGLTIEKVLQLKPERIAFYSYAHVPWKRPGQRAYTEKDLPDNSYKRRLYETGKTMLLNAGYVDIGMDHFALPDDGLFNAQKSSTLHRNFMGYTEASSALLIGLGTSAISDAKYAYAQNDKTVEGYKSSILEEHLSLRKGHYLTLEDMTIKEAILDLCCRRVLKKDTADKICDKNANDQLSNMMDEGLIKYDHNNIEITPLGMAFLRNICAVFDRKMNDQQSTEQLFSKAI